MGREKVMSRQESLHKYNNSEKGKAAQLRYRQTHREERIGINAKYRDNNSEETQAHHNVNNAIRDGKFKRSIFCEHCGLPAKTDGHHVDYSKSFEVDWLCRACHVKVHKNECVS